MSKVSLRMLKSDAVALLEFLMFIQLGFLLKGNSMTMRL